MQCRMAEIRRKAVVNMNDGCCLGYVGDIEMQMPEGTVSALIVPGPLRFFGLFGRGEEYYIPWESIRQIGDDVILIDHPFAHRERPSERRRKYR